MITRLLLHEAVGETRAIALDTAGRAVALFYDRWAEQNKRLRWGDVLGGTVRKLSPSDGGAFIALEGGREGFLPRRNMGGLVEGAHGLWRVSAEAYADKLARLVEATEVERNPGTALERWQAGLPGAAQLSFDEPPDAAQAIAAAFEDALNPIAALAGGGRLQMTPTPALVAVDVDTIGRHDKGRASVRAKTVGLAAAEELARQASLRGLGGVLVLDCISPLARRDGPDLKKRFVETFRALSTRRVECLPPSPFGLMEAVVERRWRPVAESCVDALGNDLPLTILLDGLRQIEQAACNNRGDQLVLGLPVSVFAAFKEHKKIYQTALIERFGGRIEVVKTSRDRIEVSSL